MLQNVYLAADRCRSVADSMEVPVKLGLVMVELGLSFGVQVVLAS